MHSEINNAKVRVAIAFLYFNRMLKNRIIKIDRKVVFDAASVIPMEIIIRGIEEKYIFFDIFNLSVKNIKDSNPIKLKVPALFG